MRERLRHFRKKETGPQAGLNAVELFVDSAFSQLEQVVQKPKEGKKRFSDSLTRSYYKASYRQMPYHVNFSEEVGRSFKIVKDAPGEFVVAQGSIKPNLSQDNSRVVEVYFHRNSEDITRRTTQVNTNFALEEAKKLLEEVSAIAHAQA